MKKKRIKESVAEPIGYSLKGRLIFCLIPVISMILLRLFKLNDEGNTDVIMRIIFMGMVGYGVYLAKEKRLTSEYIVFLIMMAGIVYRSGYTVYTDAFIRGHDMGTNTPNSTGHFGYLYNVLQGHLPRSNNYQFYQPPLFYILSAVFVKIGMAVTGKGTLDELLYMSQLVSCIASCVTLVFIDELLKKIKARATVRIVVMSLMSFYPVQILAAGRMNNDALAFMFMVMALYYTLLWHEKEELKYIIGIALTIGFGMMTKINCGIIAIITGPVMIYHLIKTVQTKDRNKIISFFKQLVIFSIICFPLGLWYPIRNLIKFEQPLTFVPSVGVGTTIYTGNESFFRRWLDIPLKDVFKQPYMNENEDASIPMAIIKTGVHGEFSYINLPSFLSWGLDYIHMLLIVLGAASIVFSITKDATLTKLQKYAPLCTWLLITISYIQFNVSYPYMCTADFRYIFLGQLSACIFIGYFIDFCSRNKNKIVFKYVLNTGTAIIGLFCAMSILHF